MCVLCNCSGTRDFNSANLCNDFFCEERARGSSVFDINLKGATLCDDVIVFLLSS